MTSLSKLNPDEPGDGYQPYPTHYYAPAPVPEVPEWMMVHVPANPNSKIQVWWAKVLVAPRALAIVFLWLTYQWWRFAFASATVLLVYLVITGVGGK